MTDDEKLKELELQLCQLVQEGITTYGTQIALGALVCTAASLIGRLDAENPGMNALAAWHRAFAVMYDANLFRDKLKPKDEA